jgi:pimeloyl-ACP methyl ester carboxylesterase
MSLRRLLLVGAAAAAALAAAVPAYSRLRPLGPPPSVRVWPIQYRAHDGRLRHAYVQLPRSYGRSDHPRIPLIISLHGRGGDAVENVRRWGALPAFGRFAVVSPEGQGRRLALYSWGDPAEIDDLARMPQNVEHALPWLRIDRRRIYAFGGSMGGQETLLLVAEHPHLLAGAAAFDAPTNMAERYAAFPLLRFGRRLQRLARFEIAGTPWSLPGAFAVRSPLDWVRRIAFSGVPLQIWWSTRDRIVVDQAKESGRLYREIEQLNPTGPVHEYVGTWAHTAELRATAKLPVALRLFHLLPLRSMTSATVSGSRWRHDDTGACSRSARVRSWHSGWWC